MMRISNTQLNARFALYRSCSLFIVVKNEFEKIHFNSRILIGVSVVFFFSWAPLNIFNIVDLLVKTSTDPGTQVFPAAVNLFFIS